MNKPFMYKVEFNDAKLIMDYHLQKLEGYSYRTISLHKRVIGDLLSDGKDNTSYLNFTKRSLLRWMTADIRGKSNHYAATRLQAVNRYVQFLCTYKLLPDNPLREIKPQYGRPRWDEVVVALRSPQPTQKLRSLRPSLPKHGPLCFYIPKYIELQRSLGKKYRWEHKLLCRLDTLLAQYKINASSELTIGHIHEWLGNMQCNRAGRLNRTSFLKRFLDYLIGMGVMKHNPAVSVMQEFGRISSTTFRPYIFTPGQIADILRYSKDLTAHDLFRLRPQVCYTMLALLYTLGLRNSEVRNLRFCDVNMDLDLLNINGTKFYKSRLIPFGAGVKQCIETYMSVRRKVFLPTKPEDPLFITFRRQPIGHAVLCKMFKLLIKRLSPQPLLSPRIHDLRHTFAVHRLLKWYREDADVQSKLPLLSAFMGHTTIFATEVYLTITMDLLKEANKRFYKHFGKEMHL